VRVNRARRDITRPPRFEVRELGEIDMASRALAMRDLVPQDGSAGDGTSPEFAVSGVQAGGQR
jgi:hypothetical protein